MPLDSTPDTNPSLGPIVNEAMKRFKLCAEWEATARFNFLSDLRFANGDSDNGYQWPNMVRQNRDTDQRPCLTMNVVRQHNLQIVNEAKQNKSSVEFQAVGGGATKAAADLYQAMFRREEYLSNAQSAYETACEFQVTGGIGWIRVVTEYQGPDTFNQCFRIKRVKDPLSVYMDMDCQEKDCSDARYAFVFDLVPDAELLEAYPRLRDLLPEGKTPLGSASSEGDWGIKEHTRVCEYFRRVRKSDKLVSFIDPRNGQRVELLKSKMPDEIFAAILAQPLTKWRWTESWEVQWYLIVGQRVVDRTIWPGQYIPLIRVLGEETVIDGVLDRKGHTRAMKDSQRMYNYNASSQVEFVALQGKTPWIAAAKAIEEFEGLWNTANVVNHSVLPFNSRDDEGNDLPPPERTQPPAASQAYEQGMTTAFNQMMMTSGQWQNQMGMMGNERTGEAISRRQEQGYTAVYHFQNNYAEALKFIGKQFLDVFPIIYDTRQLITLRTQDGEDFDLTLDPASPKLLQEQQDQDGKIVARVLNPRLGKFDVQADVGPAYGTRREETVKAMTLLLTQAPNLVPIIGDLLLGAMNFKEAQEAALRLKRMVPPQALGKGPTMQEVQMQKQVQALQTALAKALEQGSVAKIKLAGKDELRDIEVFEAQTKRLKVILDGLVAGGQIQQAEAQMIEDSLHAHLDRIAAQNEGEDHAD